MVRYLILASAALAVCGLLAPGLAAGAGEPAPAPAQDVDFAGKVVFVQTSKDAATLEKVQVKRLGDRFFVVGRVVDDEVLTQGAFVGSTLCLPLSEVTKLVVSDNLDALKKSVSARKGR